MTNRPRVRLPSEKETERHYVFKQLLKSRDDIKHGRLHSAEEVKAHTDKTIEGLRAKHAVREMVKSMDDIEQGRLISGDEVEQRLNKTIADFRAGDRR